MPSKPVVHLINNYLLKIMLLAGILTLLTASKYLFAGVAFFTYSLIWIFEEWDYEQGENVKAWLGFCIGASYIATALTIAIAGILHL